MVLRTENNERNENGKDGKYEYRLEICHVKDQCILSWEVRNGEQININYSCIPDPRKGSNVEDYCTSDGWTKCTYQIPLCF